MKHFSFGKYEISVQRLQENVLSVRNSKSKNSAMPSRVISSTVRNILLDFKDHGKFPMSMYNKLEGTDKEVMDSLLQQSEMAEQLGIRIVDETMADLVKQYEQTRKKIMDGSEDPTVKKQLKRTVLQLVKNGKLPLKVSYSMLLELIVLEC